MAKKTCSHCVHVCVCENRFSWLDQEDNTKHIICRHFKDSAGTVELPCKVGDTVWFIRTGFYKDELLQTTVEKIVLKSRGLHLKLACNAMYETSCNSIGKTVFLTREEAEKALAERRADND